MNHESPCGIGRSPSPLIPLPLGEGNSCRTIPDHLVRVRVRRRFMIPVREITAVRGMTFRGLSKCGILCLVLVVACSICCGATNAPCPPSAVVSGISWHWDTLKTAAPGSDLWPVTWGPDDHLYTAWGDGGGFGGTDSDGRVSLGFARIENGPQDFRGVNINGGKNAEHISSFPKKGKTSGLLFVQNTLYTLVNLQDGPWPNVNHVIAWSTNSGATWSKAEWTFGRGLGIFQPAKFLNFGRDYSGVPQNLEGFVYLIGPKQPGQAHTEKELFLARIPLEKLLHHDAYQFFKGCDQSGQPLWSSDPLEMHPVFSDPNGLTSATITYLPALKRYLLSGFHTGPGQLGIFDATEPWGPWATVAYYEDWGGMGVEGEGLNCDFPQKWMSPNNLTLWSVFSAYGDGAKKGINAHDRFNLVKVSLQLMTTNAPQR